MFPNLDPKKMQAVMRQMGIKQEGIPAKRVIIEQEEGSIIIENPDIMKIKMQGQESFQISGVVREESAGVSKEDVKIVMEKTGKSEDIVKETLEKNPDIAEAILELSD